jgi:hypothetical protein
MGTAALLPILPRSLLAAPVAGASLRRCRPSDPAWPSQSAWEQLNEAVDGNLVSVNFPLSILKSDPNSAAAKELLNNLKNPYFIRENAGLTQSMGWLDAWKTSPSVYAVMARNANDIAAAVNFARENQIRMFKPADARRCAWADWFKAAASALSPSTMVRPLAACSRLK